MIGVQGQCPDEAATGKDGPWADGFVQPTVTEQRTHFGVSRFRTCSCSCSFSSCCSSCCFCSCSSSSCCCCCCCRRRRRRRRRCYPSAPLLIGAQANLSLAAFSSFRHQSDRPATTIGLLQLWCVLSAPLTLSMDFQNKTATDSVWPIITNTHALAVNQAWAGHSGTVFPLSSNATETVTLEGKEGTTTVPTQQAWYKPLPGGGAAIFVANHAQTSAAVTIDFSRVPGLGPPAPPAHCDASAFVDLGDTQCMGLAGPAISGGGQLVNSSEACCAACSAAGAACETWGFCGADQECASPKWSKNGGTPGCFVGKSSNCPNSTQGWVGQKRKPGLVPPPPPPGPVHPPKAYVVTDVWQQAVVAKGQPRTSYSAPALASHDSIFITVAPAVAAV
jgi:hypothetical protein